MRAYENGIDSDHQDSVYFYYDSVQSAAMYGKMVILDSMALGTHDVIIVSTDSIAVDKSLRSSGPCSGMRRPSRKTTLNYLCQHQRHTAITIRTIHG